MSTIPEGQGSSIKATAKSTRTAKEAREEELRAPQKVTTRRTKTSYVYPENAFITESLDDTYLGSELAKRKAESESHSCHEPFQRSSSTLKRQRSSPPIISELFEAIAAGRETPEASERDDDAVQFLKALYKQLYLCARSSGPTVQLASTDQVKQRFIPEKLPYQQTDKQSKPFGESNEKRSKAIKAAISYWGHFRISPTTVCPLPLTEEHWLSHPMASKIPSDWHSAFFIQLTHIIKAGSVVVGEEILLEYLNHLREVVFPTREGLFVSLKEAFYPVMKRGARRLLNHLFESVEGIIDPHSGKPFLLQHLRNGIEMAHLVDEDDWQGMTVDLIDRYGAEIYEPRLRIRDFIRGFEDYSHALFMHFGPLLRLLRFKNEQEFKAEAYEIEQFFSFRLGDRDQHISMGKGGLRAIGKLVEHSQVLQTTFAEPGEWAFRASCIGLMLKELFRLFDPSNILNLLHNENELALFELALAYSLTPTEFKSVDLLTHLFRKRTEQAEDRFMILSLLAYVEVSEIEWNMIEKTLKEDGCEMKTLYLSRALYKAASDYPRLQTLHGSEIDIQLNEHTDLLSRFSELYSESFELAFIKIMLARRAGIPILETQLPMFFEQVAGWDEAVALANEQLNRALIGKSKASRNLKIILKSK